MAGKSQPVYVSAFQPTIQPYYGDVSKQYEKKFLHLFTLQVMSESGSESLEVDHNTPTYAPNVLVAVQGSGDSQAGHNPSQVATPGATNIFMSALQGTLGVYTAQVWVLSEDGYDTQDTVMYWKFIEIRYWCQLKSKIPVIRGGTHF